MIFLHAYDNYHQTQRSFAFILSQTNVFGEEFKFWPPKLAAASAKVSWNSLQTANTGRLREPKIYITGNRMEIRQYVIYSACSSSWCSSWFRRGHQLSRRLCNVAQDTCLHAAPKECGSKRPRPPRNVSWAIWCIECVFGVSLGCAHTCIYSCPLVIQSLRMCVDTSL